MFDNFKVSEEDYISLVDKIDVLIIQEEIKNMVFLLQVIVVLCGKKINLCKSFV